MSAVVTKMEKPLFESLWTRKIARSRHGSSGISLFCLGKRNLYHIVPPYRMLFFQVMFSQFVLFTICVVLNFELAASVNARRWSCALGPG